MTLYSEFKRGKVADPERCHALFIVVDLKSPQVLPSHEVTGKRIARDFLAHVVDGQIRDVAKTIDLDAPELSQGFQFGKFMADGDAVMAAVSRINGLSIEFGILETPEVL